MSAIEAPFDSSFATSIYDQRYRFLGELWPDTAERVVSHVLSAVGLWPSKEGDRLVELISQRKFLPGGRYLASAGREKHQTQNCVLLRAEDSSEGWADTVSNAMRSLLSGAGIGSDYSAVRPAGALIKSTGGQAPGPLPLIHTVNELGRGALAGGGRRAAIWAGLTWNHADIFAFIEAKNWEDHIVAAKEKDFMAAAPYDMTNISVILDKNFFDVRDGIETTAIGWVDGEGWQLTERAPDGRTWQEWAEDVYRRTVAAMVTTAEPGFSINYDNANESLRNACTEITSEDDSDICNLGSINLARIENKREMAEVTDLATLFLIAGTVYSDVPYDKIGDTRSKNRRLGLGLMGTHEWLLARGKKYGPDDELAEYLDIYAKSTGYANAWADEIGVSRPLKTRAIAPNGTIGILAETTTSAEPMFAAAYKRRVYNAGDPGDTKVEFEYVVDPVAARLVEQGIDPALIEDAYSLSYDVERRVQFQHWLQQWIDHGISSTVNLPAVISDTDAQIEFGDMLYKYLPGLRGITCYPDGSRGGQPLTSVPLEYALSNKGVRFEEHEEACIGGLCGV